ncbi:MAG: DNA double-strand break repair nuclease NurA [Candidatus ainarchaeum sp.]|nr:DNA double-strand break repair nuclease NurA [Candidatus ainarchaeum sp.]
MVFDTFLDDALSLFNKYTNSNKENALKLNPIKNMLSPNNNETFISKINDIVFSCKIAGVDSGFVSKRIYFSDLILIKLGGVIFSYDNSVLKKTDYFPSPALFPEPILLKNSLEKDEEIQSVSLERLKKEVQLAIDIIKKFFPKYLFIDGSIVPQYQDKPRNDSVLNSDYKSIIDLFQELYFVAEENNCILISTIEDSRGKRFSQILSNFLETKNLFEKDSFNNSNDSFLLDFLLNKKERTFCFSYTSDIKQHPILKDYKKEWSENIFVFYLKASNFDFPLRVEFVSKNPFEKVDEIASIVYSLSSLHKEYSYPSVLIEADLRARLKDDDISIIYNKLIDKLGARIRLRRNSRPFK